MKKFLFIFSLLPLLAGCAKQAEPVFYKSPVIYDKSVAVPLSSDTLRVDTVWGNTMTDSPFLEALKQEFRIRGWRLVVQGVTGRSGETQSINSGAAFTLVCREQPHYVFGQLQPGVVNMVLIENKTGEEIVVFRGYIINVFKAAAEVVQAIHNSAQGANS